MKLGDKDYWQVGDEVYCTSHGKGKVVCVSKYSGEVRVESRFLSNITVNDYTKTGQRSHSHTRTTLFHIGAITFDEQDRPIGINYDYAPDRTPKVTVTKLPHEFVEGEEVLVRNAISSKWSYNTFKWLELDRGENCPEAIYKCRTYNWIYCIPLKGNEHCLGKVTVCESGKIPDDYVFPKKELFSDVKVDDILYRLYDGKYIKGRVSKVSNDSFYFITDTEVSFRDTLNCIWEYTYKGELHCEEHLGQVLFFEKPKHVFKPFDRVLVRDCPDEIWSISFFSHIENEDYIMCMRVSGVGYNPEYCIPYEGNEHLLGTTNSPEE